MPKPYLLALLALFLCALPLRVQAQSLVALPGAGVEGQTARDLNELAPTILSRHTGSSSDDDKIRLALAFARLGRIEAGLRAANAMDVQDADVSNGAPLTRDEVRRIGARRKAVAGKVAEARELAGDIQNSRLRADALLAIARAQTRAGDQRDAQKTLFQALTLVGKDTQAQTYIAVLFYQADEIGASKRLLERVEKALPPLKPATSRSRQTIEERINEVNWLFVSQALIHSGQVERGAQIRQLISGFSPIDSLGPLLRAGRFDTAEKLVRADKDELRQMGNLMAVTWAARRTQPERAMALAQEVEEQLQKMPNKLEPRARDVGVPSLRDVNLALLAALYREMGQEDKATASLKQIIERSTPPVAAYIRLYYALVPLFFEHDIIDGGAERPRFSRDIIERISGEVNAELRDVNFTQFGAVLPELLDAQIECGAIEAARQTLTLMEGRTLSDVDTNGNQKREDWNRIIPALNVARGWQRLGDTKRANDVLDRIWNSPTISAVSPRDRAEKFIASGFIEEGKRRLVAVGPLSEQVFHVSPSLAYFEARSNPHAFPAWIEELHSTQLKLLALNDFVQGLTDTFFQTPSERDFTLLAGGYSSSF